MDRSGGERSARRAVHRSQTRRVAQVGAPARDRWRLRKLEGKTFRISNMGDETDETIAALLKSLDSALAETPKAAAA